MALTDLTLLQQRASGGDARAEAELGARLLVGRAAPYAPEDGARLLQRALAQDEPDALNFAAVLAALGHGRPQSWSDAVALVRKAANLGNANAKAQLDILGGEGFSPMDWVTPPTAKVRFEAPRVSTIESFISPAACTWIMDKARPTLSAARVKNPEQGGANADAIRTNTGMGLSVVDTDLVIQLIHARIAAVIGVPVAYQEPTNILHYTIGQEYRPHFDYLDPGEAHFARELQQVGQRVATFLIYLNDDYEGGETAFPRLQWSFKAKTGDALIFWNIGLDGRPDPRTLHAGTPPTRGEKWLFSKWVRDRALPLI